MAGTGTQSYDCLARYPDALGAGDLVHAARAEHPPAPDQGPAGSRDLVCGFAGLYYYFSCHRTVSGWRAVPCAEGCVCYVTGRVVDVGCDAGCVAGDGGIFVSGGGGGVGGDYCADGVRCYREVLPTPKPGFECL